MTPDITAAYNAFPASSRPHALALRAVIMDAAASMPEIGGLVECLKWGQPAYLPVRPRIGTTLRIGADARSVSLFVPCSTTLVDGWRDQFPDQSFSKNRAVRFPIAVPLPRNLIALMARAALRYHLAKRG